MISIKRYNAEQWDIFRNSVAFIESGGDYSVPGGSGMHYAGRYRGAETDSKCDPRSRALRRSKCTSEAVFSANKELQETIFTGFTLAKHLLDGK